VVDALSLKMPYRLFFGAGPGNIIAAHQSEFAGQMSVTFSSEFEALCKANDAAALMISSGSPAGKLVDGGLILENRPKRRANGWRYHLNEIRYGLGLAIAARRFRATHAFLQSGSTHYFVMSVFRVLGIKVIPIMHNTLWPSGYPEVSAFKRMIRKLDGMFFRYAADAVLTVSPECARQVRALTKSERPSIETFTIQFDAGLFPPLPPPPISGRIVVTFAGRVTRNKGALDIVQIAQEVSARTSVLFHVCGDGPDLELLRHRVAKSDLDDVVKIHGWTEPAELRRILADSHFSIVPTRSDFNEGMAMTVIEPILLGRPVITSPVVPASEVLRDACVLARTDDPSSYADAIIDLAADQERYARLCAACLPLRRVFFDRNQSSQAAMQRVLKATFSPRIG